MSKLTIYSEDVHDYVLLAYTDIILESHYNKKIQLITYDGKLDRLNAISSYFFNQSFFNIRKLQSMGDNPKSRFLEILKKTFIKTPRFLMNSLKLTILLLKQRKQETIIATEIYKKTHAFLLYFISLKLKNIQLILTIHNADKFTKKKNIFNALFTHSKRIIVLSDSVCRYLSKNTNKPISVFPAAIPSSNTINLRKSKIDKLNNSSLSFCVTGSVDQNRKDYFKIIKYFSKIRNINCKVIFLGKLVTKELKQFAIDMGVDVVFFDDYVEDNVFKSMISEAHFLFSLNSNEDYLQGKISGIMYDALRYGVPLMTDNPTFESNYIEHISIFDFPDFNLKITKYSDRSEYNKIAKKALNKSKEALPVNLLNNNKTIKDFINEL